MDKIKLFEGELKLMELLWEHEGSSAKELSLMAAKKIGWNKNTTYTVIKKLIKKGAIKRSEPGFICHSLISREKAGLEEAKELIDSFFDGSLKAFFSSFMSERKISAGEAEELRKLIDEYGTEG
ncbi:MAG TPA: BlaI/MecI/CopY family transcriptional regulator [Clostridiaceae bacterium]|jgi:BlaI family penicillinase repressor|nr:BlaI/MecI/CopY family transcriptional regulator [Clostridiaceae bacterium]